MPVQVKVQITDTRTSMTMGLASFGVRLIHYRGRKMAELSLLFPTEEDAIMGRFLRIQSLGVFFLELVNCLNIACNIQVCSLTDQSTKMVCTKTSRATKMSLRETLLLSRGFSWYSGHGYLARKLKLGPPDVEFEVMLNTIRGLVLADVFAGDHATLVKYLKNMFGIEQKNRKTYLYPPEYSGKLVRSIRISDNLLGGSLMVSAMFDIIMVGVRTEDENVCQNLDEFMRAFRHNLEKNYPEFSYTLRDQIDFSKLYNIQEKPPTQTKRVKRLATRVLTQPA